MKFRINWHSKDTKLELYIEITFFPISTKEDFKDDFLVHGLKE